MSIVTVLDDVAGGMVPIGDCTHIIGLGLNWLNVSKRTLALLRVAGMGEDPTLTPGVLSIFEMGTTKPLADLQTDEAFLAAKLRGLDRTVEESEIRVSEAEKRYADSVEPEEVVGNHSDLYKAKDQLRADQFEHESVRRRHEQVAQALAVALAFNAN